MIPELGKYAAAVLSSYGVSLVLMVGLILMSLWRGGRVRRQLDEIEARRKSDG
ncbi:Cytochrome c-type biogenesis protein CcmD, interacts with CcmCE [Rhodovulum sp. P5]|uniref:heme exporter protein CcmD n=1 Tax=Rhodovulum sp. P5 TaxID=1564506 RepID=UPI0009C2D4DC|nr:heme exporter protein CcmD [Rhodovulum sp. P5]ARE38490.1 Cytochrome c-type biogenesis protein CcmD, interacts with CcmCE [Rhodovulum sp. P5]